MHKFMVLPFLVIMGFWSCKTRNPISNEISSIGFEHKVLLLHEFGKELSEAPGSKMVKGKTYEFWLCDRREDTISQCENPFMVPTEKDLTKNDLVLKIDETTLGDLKKVTTQSSFWFGILDFFHRVLGVAGVGASVYLVRGVSSAIGTAVGGAAGTVIGPGPGSIVGGVAGFAGGMAIGTAAGATLAGAHAIFLSHTTNRWKEANQQLLKYFDEVFALDQGLKIKNVLSRKDIGFVLRGVAHTFHAKIKPKFDAITAGDPLEFE